MYQSGKKRECIELQNWSTSPLLCNLAANKGVGTLERVIGQLMSPIKKENCSAKKTLTNKGGGGSFPIQKIMLQILGTFNNAF